MIRCFILLVSCLLMFMSSVASFAEEFLGTYRNTNYYVVMEADYSAYPADAMIRDRVGNVIAHVSTKFKKAVDIEGTGKLIDGRVINFTAVVNKEIRYRLTDAPWGLGVGNCELDPFHSIAVDPTTIPLGSVVRIEETVGMVLPDGSIHDGIWIASDVGGAIKKDRIDLFVGTRKWGIDYLTQAKIGHLQALHITQVFAPDSDSCVNPLTFMMSDEFGDSSRYR